MLSNPFHTTRRTELLNLNEIRSLKDSVHSAVKYHVRPVELHEIWPKTTQKNLNRRRPRAMLSGSAIVHPHPPCQIFAKPVQPALDDAYFHLSVLRSQLV